MLIFLLQMYAALTRYDLPSRPDRQNDWSGPKVTDRHRAFSIACLLRHVINYAKELRVTMRLRAGAPDFALLIRPFGINDIGLIIVIGAKPRA